MAKKNKKARFFCECCDREVDGDAKFCPYCGRFFASVRCPHCAYTGSNNLFKDGCPQCGYATDKKTKSNTKKDANNVKRKRFKKNRVSDDSLPFWVYLLSIVLLIVVLLIITQYV
ncbi:MAG TPA: zinc ribbon domain-containing protein [Treponemataceae bacterium]|nr:zinc ribbon domain-containing protein [Treponemataceae bacterium]